MSPRLLQDHSSFPTCQHSMNSGLRELNLCSQVSSNSITKHLEYEIMSSNVPKEAMSCLPPAEKETAGSHQGSSVPYEGPLPHCTADVIWCDHHNDFHRTKDILRRNSFRRRLMKAAAEHIPWTKLSHKPKSADNVNRYNNLVSQHVNHGAQTNPAHISERRPEPVTELSTPDARYDTTELEGPHTIPDPHFVMEPVPSYYYDANEVGQQQQPQSMNWDNGPSGISPPVSRTSTGHESEESIFSHGASVDTLDTRFSSAQQSQVFDKDVYQQPCGGDFFDSNDASRRILTDAVSCSSPEFEPSLFPSNQGNTIPEFDLEPPLVSPISPSSICEFPVPDLLAGKNSHFHSIGEQERSEWNSTMDCDDSSCPQAQWNVQPILPNNAPYYDFQNDHSSLPMNGHVHGMPDTSNSEGSSAFLMPNRGGEAEFLELLNSPGNQFAGPLGNFYGHDGDIVPQSTSFEAGLVTHCPASTRMVVDGVDYANGNPIIRPLQLTAPKTVPPKPSPSRPPRNPRQRPSPARRGSSYTQHAHSHDAYPQGAADPASIRKPTGNSLTCDRCDYSPKGHEANQKTNLRRHKRSVHKVNGPVCIPCPHCDVTFNRSDNVKPHVTKFHPKSPLPLQSTVALQGQVLHVRVEG